MMALQASPQPVQSSIPPDAYAADAPSSRRHYIQQSPQLGDTYRASSSPQSARRTTRQQGGNASQSSNPSTPQQYRSPTASQPSNSSTTPRGPQMPQATYTSPTPIVSNTQSPPELSRREQQNEQDQTSGPPIAPPPRTSSNQRSTALGAGPTVQLVDRTATTSQQDRGSYERRSPREQGQRIDTEDGSRRWRDQGRITDDSATSAATAARARRRAPASPEGPNRSASTRETRAQQSPQAIQSRSAANIQVPAPPTKLSREGSEVINRVIVSDPSVDAVREKERLAEAIPMPSSPSVSSPTGLGLVGSEGVDDGGRGPRQSRQDYSSTAGRRKETKLGEFVLGQTLGEGEFGKVKLGWRKDGSVQVAIKLIRRENLNTNPSRQHKIYREIKILEQLSHPNIVRLHEVVETERHIGIILEYASGGELFDYILTHRYLKDNAARRLFAQLVSGVGYLHKNGIVHRDLKLENLLLDRNRNIIITDFGFANTFNPRDELGEEIESHLGDKDFVKNMGLEKLTDGFRRGDLMQTSCGSPCYAAPELVVTDSLYTGRKVDVWSCGVILYAMLAGYLPFDDDPANPEGDNINLLYKYIVSTPLTFPEYVTPHARDLLRRILVPDPRQRADLFEVARHSWLSDYAHVVSHVTSSTTTIGEIANSTVTSDHLDAPLLARSASVREPSKPHVSNMSPVGGLGHQGKIDLDQVDKAKSPREPKRRTVQLEYVEPQSQTMRGEMSPPLRQQTVGFESAPMPKTGTRARSGSQGATDASRKTSAAVSARKPLPSDPPVPQESSQAYQQVSTSGRTSQRPLTSESAMLPPMRPAREPPRSASDSTGAFAPIPSPSGARPTTGGSMASNSAGRLPSRGNSYSQPLAPTVAVTNAQGKLAQPKNARPYNISAPIPHPEPYISDPSIGRPSTQRLPSRHSQMPAPREETKSHKRSNTFSNVFGRSGSFFGGRSQPQSPNEEVRPQPEKRYPPTSMKAPIVSDSSPRQSSDSRRPSFSFGRKKSDLSRQETDLSRQDNKPRRFSLLPASFSLKNLTGNANAQASDGSRPMSQRKQSHNQAQYNRNSSHDNSEESIPIHDGTRDRDRYLNASAPNPSRHHDDQYASPTYAVQPQFAYASRAQPQQQQQQSYFNDPTPPTDSDLSLSHPAPQPHQNQQPNHHRPRYPPGFNSYDDDAEPRPSMQQTRPSTGRGPGVLQKSNRKFADAYEGDGEARHAGSSGAAKRVMDFFRRRGRARGGDGG